MSADLDTLRTQMDEMKLTTTTIRDKLINLEKDLFISAHKSNAIIENDIPRIFTALKELNDKFSVHLENQSSNVQQVSQLITQYKYEHAAVQDKLKSHDDEIKILKDQVESNKMSLFKLGLGSLTSGGLAAAILEMLKEWK